MNEYNEAWNSICTQCSVGYLYDNEEIINWKEASKNPNLTIDLIWDHKDEIDFYEVFQWAPQDILDEFQREFKDC